MDTPQNAALLLSLRQVQMRFVQPVDVAGRIANLLGVRREGVTGGALKLQKAGLIDYRRGHISIIDRIGLEARSCECYGVVRQAYDRLSCTQNTPRQSPGAAFDHAASVVVYRQAMQAA